MQETEKRCRKANVHMHETGKECREMLYQRMKYPPRHVPAFTYQALQSNTIVIPPKRIALFKKRPVKETFFKIYFKRGDIPVASSGKAVPIKKPYKDFPVRWYCNPVDLDYCYYLPIFVDGVSDSDIELRQLAQYAAIDMIIKAPHKILPVLPKLILPLKRAFNTRDKKIIIAALKVLQIMVLVGPCVGQALVPYYRQLLAVCNLYKNINVNLGSGIDPDRDRRIGDVIEDTLQMLESCGGPNAFINIKYMIPTYESSVQPKCTQQPPANANPEENHMNATVTGTATGTATGNPPAAGNPTAAEKPPAEAPAPPAAKK